MVNGAPGKTSFIYLFYVKSSASGRGVGSGAQFQMAPAQTIWRPSEKPGKQHVSTLRYEGLLCRMLKRGNSELSRALDLVQIAAEGLAPKSQYLGLSSGVQPRAFWKTR